MAVFRKQENAKNYGPYRKSFEIRKYGNTENLHLRLEGVFDPDAAKALLDALKHIAGRFDKVFVHTSPLEELDESAAELFREGLSGFSGGFEIIFTGDYGERLVLQSNSILFVR